MMRKLPQWELTLIVLTLAGGGVVGVSFTLLPELRPDR